MNSSPTGSLLVTLNAGSSSIRVALYDGTVNPRLRLRARIEGPNPGSATLTLEDPAGARCTRVLGPTSDRSPLLELLLDWLQATVASDGIAAVGHRVVHGMHHSEPQVVTPVLLAELKEITPFDPEHLPIELALMQAVSRRWPTAPQFACFDTAFHRAMPELSRVLPIPRRFGAVGVERYGFHGLSYQYQMEELARLEDPAVNTGRIILAHLGNGASMTAVLDGRSLDTSMGFTPTGGLVMGTRSGDLDPGVGYFLSRTEAIDAAEFQRLTTHDSGLLGVSQLSADMRELLAAEGHNPLAAQAIALFCYSARKWIGAFAAALNGLDTLVFAGGIGENAPAVRERICVGLSFLGVALDTELNAANASIISAARSAVRIRVIRTDEEQMIARAVTRLLALPPPQGR